MEKVRIGNDMRVNFSVYRNGEPESFDGASNIVTKLVNEAYNKLITHTCTIAGNIVQFDIDALQLTQCGKCRLFISYTKGGDYTVDSPAFELVNYTDQTGGTEIIGVEIVSINISGDIGINRDGLSAYEVWESYPGNEGKTIEEYFLWLRENPTKIDLNGLNSNIDKLHFNPDTLVQLTSIGDVRYSTESKTLEVKVSDTVSIQLGQEMQTRVKNNAGTQINNGQMVYIDSAAGANPLAKIASTSNADIAQRTFGMATENIPANGFGAITTEGLVRDINTSAFPEGAMLWLGANGSVTNIEPVAPTSKISVGMVLRSNIANGVIYVKIRAIARNQKLSDVYAPTLTTGDVLRWNSTTLRFEVYNLSNKADLVAGKIPASQLPAYVDDIIEYANLAAFPAVGETGKLYVTLDTNLTYRWSGSAYAEVSKSLALGETSATAYMGDRGKTAYDHSQLTNSNPHGTTAAQITNTPAGTISATTVQAAINELDADRVQLETDLNANIDQVRADLNKIALPVVAVDFNSNPVIVISYVDVDTDTFTSVGHGLVDGNEIAFAKNDNTGVANNPLYYMPLGIELIRYFVAYSTVDTFKVSTTLGGPAVNITANATMDLSKIHVEKLTFKFLNIKGIPPSKVYRVNGIIRCTQQNAGAVQVKPRDYLNQQRWYVSGYNNVQYYAPLASGSFIYAFDMLFKTLGKNKYVLVNGIRMKVLNQTTLEVNDSNRTLTDAIETSEENITDISITSTAADFFFMNGTSIKIYNV